MRSRTNSGVFPVTVAWIVGVFAALKWGFPYLSQVLVDSEHPLAVPGALMAIFMILTLIAAAVYVTVTDEGLTELKRAAGDVIAGRAADAPPSRGVTTAILLLVAVVLVGGMAGRLTGDLLVALLGLLFALGASVRGTAFRVVRGTVAGAAPLLVGWLIYAGSAQALETPIALRIQHPTLPGQFESLGNPFRQAPAEEMAAALEEGRVLYQKNCRPCHGTKAAGDGPMARAFRLKPANFRDPGTIATVVESYAFWRIKEGAPGLPRSASPWDSAMPVWGQDLSDEEIWKIITAEYHTAGMEPRKPEKME